MTITCKTASKKYIGGVLDPEVHVNGIEKKKKVHRRYANVLIGFYRENVNAYAHGEIRLAKFWIGETGLQKQVCLLLSILENRSVRAQMIAR